MIVISEAQMAASRERMRRGAVEDLSAFVRRHFADRLTPAEDRRVEEVVEAEWLRADEPVPVGESDLKLLLVLRFTFGERWREARWAKPILADPFGRKPDRLADAARPHAGAAGG